MVIIIASVPKSRIRNDQCGDWRYDNKDTLITVDDSLPVQNQIAIALHETVEAWLCSRDGVTDEEVCSFDEKYEAERKEGKHSDDDEPGDDPRSPYRTQHMAATHVERAVCAALGINWGDHCNAIITEG